MRKEGTSSSLVVYGLIGANAVVRDMGVFKDTEV
jgi:hypothetical protein